MDSANKRMCDICLFSLVSLSWPTMITNVFHFPVNVLALFFTAESNSFAYMSHIFFLSILAVANNAAMAINVQISLCYVDLAGLYGSSVFRLFCLGDFPS